MPNDVLIQAAIALIINESNSASLNSLATNCGNNPFSENSSFRVNTQEQKVVRFMNNGTEETVTVTKNEEANSFNAKTSSSEWMKVNVEVLKESKRFAFQVDIEGSVSKASFVITPETVTLFNEVISLNDRLDSKK